MQFILVDESRRQNAIAHIKSLDLKTKWGVDVKPYKKNRSLAQNNTMWLWLGLIGDFMGESAEDLHDLFKMQFLGYEEKTIAGEPVTRLRSTAKLSTIEFSQYMTKIEMVAKELFIVLPYPDDYKDL